MRLDYQIILKLPPPTLLAESAPLTNNYVPFTVCDVKTCEFMKFYLD